VPAKVQLRNRLAYVEPGRVVTDADYDLLVTGEVDVYKPNGDRLCSVRREVVSQENREAARPVLRKLKSNVSRNRGVAAGGERTHPIKQDGTVSSTGLAAPVHSSIVGFFDRYPRVPYCRQTAFNAEHPAEFDTLRPAFSELSACFGATVPERFKAQMGIADKTSHDFVISGTPWTTITVNYNWPTHTHTDSGDLDEGFSCLTVLRSGSYRGGVLVFPAFRAGVDLHDGDLIMMDSHESHANTPFEDTSDDFERIAMVLYYRTKMKECGTAAEELERAKHLRGDLSAAAEGPELG
jgi:hypothetical protein